MSTSIPALSLWRAAVTPWCEMVGTAADHCGLVYWVMVHRSSPSALLRDPSQQSFLAFLMALSRALFASSKSPWLAVALLLFLLTRPRSLLLSSISWFHHLFDLAYMVMTRTCLFRMSARVAMIHSISSSSSFGVQLSDTLSYQQCSNIYYSRKRPLLH